MTAHPWRGPTPPPRTAFSTAARESSQPLHHRAEVGGLGVVQAGGHEHVHAAGGKRCGVVGADAACGIDGQPRLQRAQLRHERGQLRGRHFVELHAVRPGAGGDQCVISAFGLDEHEFLRAVRLGARHQLRRIQIRQKGAVLGEHQNGFRQPGAVHHAAAAQHGVVLQLARSGMRLARARDLNAWIARARGIDHLPRGAGDAAQVFDQVHALFPGHVQRVRVAVQPQHRLPRRGSVAIGRERLGAQTQRLRQAQQRRQAREHAGLACAVGEAAGHVGQRQRPRGFVVQRQVFENELIDVSLGEVHHVWQAPCFAADARQRTAPG